MRATCVARRKTVRFVTTQGTDSELQRQLEAYFDGRLTPAETEALGRRLQADPAARRAYWEVAHWHATLTVWGEQASGRNEALADVPEASATKPADRTRGWAWAALALAACLAFVFTLGVRPYAGNAGAFSTTATLTYESDALWTATSPVRGKALLRGDYELRRGVVRFETTAGAVVTIAAPARFRFVSAARIELARGRLTARMLRDEAELTVRVGDMEVRDLGTAFGIDANDGNRTLVSVFDGAVAVTDSKKKGPGQQVGEGQSLVGSRNGATHFERAAYESEVFKDLWPLTVGINEASRLVEFLPPGPLLKPLRSYRANDRLFLFPEQRNVVTTKDLEIDLSRDVRAWPESPVSPYPLARGARVNSYLVFFQPDPSATSPRRLHGSITFQQRIVGVACADFELEGSDAQLGDPKADYATPGQSRGLESEDKVNRLGSSLPHDSIRIGADGRTLLFDFYVIDEREQMRVIVAAD